MSTPELIVTGITGMPAEYRDLPQVITLELYDSDGGKVNSEIHLDEGVDFEKIKGGILVEMQKMKNLCVRVHVVSVRIKKHTNGLQP